ncbi:hypothetical protein BT96DRAFT_925531 [Gymnopus androsaceus JB14]|uniref:Anti-proliferative protein domain-containing protein n=1 Tax=Gymnopus androsaceus JB14 TaxID=1447944 RepID=A0A6A4H1K2_9AGAR|nr:hypothetical protein BT96DRAFT_925531 [Gymnopus androsaceus JB14]
MISTSNATLFQLMTLLTRPLALAYPVQTVAQLELFLHANFASIIPTQQPISPFTLLLSPTHLPPTPIYAACLQAGIEWAEWIRALGGKVMYVFVREGCLKLRIGETGDVVTLWEEDPTDNDIPMISKLRNRDTQMIEKLKGMLDSVRQQPISLPTLFPLPASEDDDECMSDSDSESTASSSSSSCFSDASAESMTSVSSSGSASSPKKTSVYVPPAKARLAAAVLKSDSIPSHRLSSFSLSHSQRRSSPVVIAPSKPRARYTYQGGETGVVTGGVMLGKAAPAAAPIRATTTATREPLRRSPRKHSGTVMLGPDSVSNWRRVRA